MTSNIHTLPVLHPVAGLRLGTTCAGIKQPDRRDLVVMELCDGATVAAVFTRNAFCAAPVIVAREHRAQTSPRYLLINTGNANAGTGEQGMTDALACCDAVAQAAGCAREAVLPFSTGVISEPLQVTAICDAVPAALAALDENGWADAAHGILTTDTVPKGVSRELEIDGHRVTITGIAKGSGMIRPDMATMLAYVATDANVPQNVLQACLARAMNKSFNRITVDGDTSTNDACLLMATGQSVATVDQTEGDTFDALCAAVTDVCEQLALAVVRDGEGATKLITVAVEGGRDAAECLQVAYTIAHSPLVKTAFFASDPNWGRILAAVGRAGLVDLDINAIELYLDDVCLACDGGRAPDYREELGQQVMDKTEITVRVVLSRGDATAQIWTCDLSYDYVRINAEYRS
ncbi:MAG: bifunctional glutamate N-acetyltransferase/amino-acid acetyltransferase ArgJ [Gammaproteobacteria bacterium]|nr:bifunctional glutamate N-acetyltransferase/amino-acid acetyltransferase ArgJ [Gammaproteobacteria bacterium]MCF6259138.1 bifunctional glutamate N-acetyltransferase/amino-acid acetyltransferase ArgJ [Gammaproteobacteria bacterium]